MKAMILAAGKGTRVRPITHTTPKPMIPILQKPVMEFLLELLREHGFDQIMVNVSHLAEEIENYFRDGQRFGVEIAYSFEGRIEDGELIGDALGSAGGLKKIQDFQEFFDDTFVVICGDALIDLDLTEAVRRHKQKGALASLITKRVPKEQVSSYGVVVTDDAGRVLSFQEKPAVDEAASDTINTGIYIFEPEVFDFIPSDIPFRYRRRSVPEAGGSRRGVLRPADGIRVGGHRQGARLLAGNPQCAPGPCATGADSR